MVDGDLHVEGHLGAADGPVVVLVHGVFDSCDSFAGVIEQLVPDHTVLTYDRRGWGRSAAAAPATSLADHALDLLSIVGERRVTVVGHSYGGTVSLLGAVRAPERIAALGLFEP
jgi:pimeloyl-ACP methyl ester carboxylesterase